MQEKLRLRDERIESMEAALRSAVLAGQEQTEQHVMELLSLKQQLEVCFPLFTTHTLTICPRITVPLH